jgi:hypothetical protein
MSEWIAHVKAFQAQHGCSYKDALKHASPTYRAMKGGKVNRLKKAQAWTGYAGNTVNQGMDLADRGMHLFGGKVNRLKKAGRWTGYAGDTANTGLNLAGKAMALGALGGFGLKKHRKRKMSGQALMPAGAY